MTTTAKENTDGEAPGRLRDPRAVLIVNTKSRTGRDRFAETAECLRGSSLQLLEAIAVNNPKEISGKIQQAIASKTPLVIVGGGDGTLSQAARYFIGSESVMGVLPLGTGNEFARDLSITPDVAGACSVLTTGRVVRVDVGRVNNGYFINVATVGLTTMIARELTPDAKKRLGKFVYVFAALRAVTKVRAFEATLTTPDESRTFPTLQVVIGNGRFHAGPFPIAPDARITSGRLVVYALASADKRSLLRYALSLPGGRQVYLPDMIRMDATEGSLTTRPAQKATVDGETNFSTPLQFSMLHDALPVMVPADFAG